jgi:HAD superfamily hydrolase (TIGR01509 family)
MSGLTVAEGSIEAVFFDCDGIVLDSDGLQAVAEQETAGAFAAMYGLDYDPDSVDWDGMRGWARKKIAAALFGVEADSELAEAFRLAVVDTTVDIMCADNLSLIPGFAPFVGHVVARGCQVGLATSSHRDIYTRYGEVHPIDHFPPHYIVAYGECVDDKPKAGPYRELMKRAGVAPQNTLVVEDSSTGITSGRYAGAQVLALSTTKPADYLRSQTDAQLVAASYPQAAQMLQPFLPR